MYRTVLVSTLSILTAALPAQGQRERDNGKGSVDITVQIGGSPPADQERQAPKVTKPDPQPGHGEDWRQRLRKAGDDDPALRLRMHRLADADGDGKLSDGERGEFELMFRMHLEGADYRARRRGDPQPGHGEDWRQRLRKAGDDDPALRIRLRKLADEDGDGELSSAEEERMGVLIRAHWEARESEGRHPRDERQAEKEPARNAGRQEGQRPAPEREPGGQAAPGKGKGAKGRGRG